MFKNNKAKRSVPGKEAAATEIRMFCLHTAENVSLSRGTEDIIECAKGFEEYILGAKQQDK